MKALTLEDLEASMSRNTRKHNADVVDAMRNAIAYADTYGSEYGWIRRDIQQLGDDNAVQA